MKHFKLFLMTLLLCVGVSSAWGYDESYNIVYQGRTNSQGAGYTVKNTNVGNYSTITSDDNANPLVVSRSGNNNPTDITSNTVVNLITPNSIEGYVATMSVTAPSNRVGTITITYAPMSISYRVIWDEEFVTGGGYTVTTAGTNAGISTGNNAEILTISSTTQSPAELTSETLARYISPNTVTGYTTNLYLATNEKQLGYIGTIYINYITNTTPTVITDDDKIWDYSNVYTRNTNTVVKMPDGECAISLHLTGESITEQKKYYIYRIEWGNSYRYFRTTTGSGIEWIESNDYPNNENGTTLNGNTTNATDPDDDGFGTDAEYKFVSKGTTWEASNLYLTGTDGTRYDAQQLPFVYDVTHTIGTSHVENAVIPLTAPDGRKVTAIQKWGLCYKKEDVVEVPNCEINDNGEVTDNILGYVPLVDDHSNDYLKTVTFQKDANGQSNLESIGDYAFMSCLQLTDVDIPFSVRYLGQGLFEMDRALKNVNFQTGAITVDGVDYANGVQFNTIRNFTFWMCTAMETLVLPDGIIDIEGQQSGASLQYLTSLTTLTLPNTLKHIGPHFLCSCSSMKTLTIPVSVVYIDGASFHGCESLETVYILGPAATLMGEFAESGSDSSSSTFSANTTLCKEAVSDCTFYTTSDHLAGYQNDDVWSRIDNNGEHDHANGKFGNYLKVIPGEERLFPSNWVTALFPYSVEDFASNEKFGAGTKVAVMDDSKHPTYTQKVVNGKEIRVYNLEFKLLDATATDIPANTPVLIKAGRNDYVHTFYTDKNQEEDYWKTNSTIAHSSSVTATDGAVITMKGEYLSHMLQPYDFYFLYEGKTKNMVDGEWDGTYTYPSDPAKFYRVSAQANAPTVKPCRCYWSISVDGIKSASYGGAAKQSFFMYDETTGIDKVDAVQVNISIYDLNGRKLNVSENELPRGLYIVNGKKVLVK